MVYGCNLPLPKVRDYASEIPFPTPGPSSTANLIPNETSESPIDMKSYLQTIQEPLFLEDGFFHYHAQSGDSLRAVANHFGVDPNQIRQGNPGEPLDPIGLLNPGDLLLIPDVIGVVDNQPLLLPDSEVIFSPSAEYFDIQQFIMDQGGYLASFHQQVGEESLSGAEIVALVAQNTSINPRLLLAIIEFRSGWLTSIPEEVDLITPLGFGYKDFQGFYLECSLAAKWLNMGYYGWRNGLFTHLSFIDGNSMRLAPQSNAGTVALQFFFAQIYPQSTWATNLFGPQSIVEIHEKLFGDAWKRAEEIEPLFTRGFQTPELELPFGPGEEWALTGGLHLDWNSGTPSGALDFAPVTGEPRCSVSRAWVRTSAKGIVTRSSENIVVIALKNSEGALTGWELFYMHIADSERVTEGTQVNLDDPIGHPSCEGGITTGTHVHFARKFKGEWIGAGDPIPLILSGWTALPGEKQFQSSLVKGDQVITARQDGGDDSIIYR